MDEGGSKALGKAIGDARRAKEMTQQDLCAAADLSYSTLAKIERGAIKTPSVFTVAAIARATDTTVEALLGLPAVVSVGRPTVDYKVSKTGVKFVYFDVNGVMVRFFHRAFSRIAVDCSASADHIESTFWHYNDAVCRGEMSVDEFNAVLAQTIGKDSIDWQEYYMTSIEPITEVQECLQWARQHYHVGLLTNIFPGFLEDMSRRGLLPSLDGLTLMDSSQVNAIKPEKKLYQIATERSGVDSQDILLIDDSRTNLSAAEAEGWHVLWFDDFRPQESVERIKATLEY